MVVFTSYVPTRFVLCLQITLTHTCKQNFVARNIKVIITFELCDNCQINWVFREVGGIEPRSQNRLAVTLTGPGVGGCAISCVLEAGGILVIIISLNILSSDLNI